jgi:hypothetical protein
MTEPAPVVHPMPTVVDPHGQGRLAQLHAAYPEAKAAVDAATERLKEINNAIKGELWAAAPEQQRVELHTPGHKPLRLTYAERWTFDSKRLKAEDPVRYMTYAKKGGSWTLSEVKDGDV